MAVNKITMNTPEGEQTLIDLTGDSVTPKTLAEGAIAHNAAGEQIVGEMPTTTVLYTEQTLTEAQQERARQNIDAASPSDVSSYVDNAIAAIPTPDVSGQIGEHNVATTAHSDIRLLITELTNRLNVLANSDDTTLDQMGEVVAYIKANRGLIEEVTTKKVNVSDIIDNLTTNVTNKPLSAAQGVVLKGLIDALNTNLANYQPKGDYALKSEIPAVPVKSVNGKTGEVSLSASDVGAMPSTTKIPAKTSDLTNDSGFITGYTETDPTVPAWAKAASKPKYTASEVGALSADTLSGAVDDALAQAKASGEFDGTSVTVKSVSESTTDGGSNVVTFSDGKTLTVKNGKTGSKGSDGRTPVKGTDYFTTADKAEIVADVQAAMDGVPDYWRTDLSAGVEAINTALCTAGMNKSAFLFYSDAHWTSGSKMAPTLLKYLYQHTGMTRTFFGGDIVNTEGSDYDTMKYLWDWRNQLKDLPNHHSVVGNHDDGNATNNLFSEQYIYGYMYAAEETSDVVRGGVTWYYIDSGSEKTRYIFLDTAYKGMNSDQTAFLKDSLKSTPDGWHIVVVAHIWYMPDYDQYDVKPIPIIGLSSAAATVGTILDKYNSRTDEFSSCAAKVEFCIGGHTHIDYTGATTGGIPIILVETDSHHTRSGLSCLIGTPTESSVNGIIADYNTNKVNIVRVGRGNSFIVDLTTGESEVVPDDSTPDDSIPDQNPIYTNQIPISTDTDGSIYNEVGYSTGRLSSDGTVTSDGAMSVTGFIPCKMLDTVRLRGVNFNKNSNTFSTHRIMFYDSSKKFLSGALVQGEKVNNLAAVWNDEGDLIQFTVNEYYGGQGDNYAYFRICGDVFDNYPIITVNEPIVEESAYINQIPISTDTDGSIYNSTGYKTGYRINSSGVLAESSANAATGFIPFRFGDIAYISADVFEGNTGYCVISAFNGEKNFLGGAHVKNATNYLVTDANGNYVFDPARTTESGMSYWKSAAFIRVTGMSAMNDDSIITVNEPIE